MLFSILFWNTSFSQSNNFEFTYGRYMSCGILHDIGYPLITIKNNSLTYSFKQITSKFRLEKYGENNEETDTIWLYELITKHVKIRESSKDSLINAVKQFTDTLKVSFDLHWDIVTLKQLKTI